MLARTSALALFALLVTLAGVHPAALSAAPLFQDQGAPTDTAATKQATKELPLEPTRTLAYTAEEGSWISLDVSPDGSTIVFDLLGDLYTMPISGGKATRLTHGMAYDVQPRFSPDGTKVVFVSDRSGGNNVWIMSLDGRDTTQVTKGNDNTFLSPIWTPDGKYIVASGKSGNLKLWLFHVDGGTGTALISEPATRRTTGAAFGPDERFIWYHFRTGGWDYNAVFPQYQIAAYDRETGTSTTMTSRYGSAVRPALSPDGRWLVYGTRHEFETGLRIRDLASGEERWLAYPVQRDEQESVASLDALPGYAFTPDSREIVASFGGQIWRVPVDGGAQRRIPFSADVEVALGPRVDFDFAVDATPDFNARQIRDAVPSPDGRQLAFSALGKLYVMDYPNGTPRRLTDLAVGEHLPTWSPDGGSLAFVTWTDEEGGHIYRVRAQGRANVQRLTTTPAYFNNIAWSSSGDRIIAVRGAARDVQENLGGFGGGLGTEFVWLPAGGGPLQVVAPTAGRRGLHFTQGSDRIHAYHPARGLVSFRWDGTDEKAHVIVRGTAGPGGGQAPPASSVMMAPLGDQALAQVGMDLFVVTVPVVGGETPTISVANPENAAFPVRRLTDIGGQFQTWSADAKKVHWSVGNAHFVYDLERAKVVEDSLKAEEARKKDEKDEKDADEETGGDDEGNDDADEETGGDDEGDAEAPADDEKKDDEKKGYRPVETRIAVSATRDIPTGVSVLRGGRAITMRGHEIIENADIVIRNNRIEAVGRRGEVTVPEGAEVIDMTGRTLLPGFVDTHYHTQWLIGGIHSTQVWQYLTNLAYGVTTTQDVQTASTDILSYHDRVETGEMIGPRIFHTGPGVFAGERLRDLDHARDVLRRYRDYYDVNTFKMYMSGNRQQRQWLIMAARELRLMPTTEGGLDFKLNMTHAIDGYSGLEHSLPIFPLFSDVRNLFVEAQITYSPTLLVSYGGPWAENYFYATEDIFNDPKMSHFTPYNELASKGSRRGGPGAGWFREGEHVFQHHSKFVADLLAAGGRAGVGAHGQLHGVGYHWELWSMQSGGLSEHDALRAATILGAEGIGFGSDLGSIEPGKLADIVVLDADPLADIRNSNSIRYVMKNGRLYEADTLNEIWPRQRTLPSYHWQRQAPATSAGIPIADH